MKAKDLLLPGSELHHKVRSVSDLIRHVETRETESITPNYNLFFGAGCSVSSDINPANALIESWLYELYERYESHEPETIEVAKVFFENNHSNWYNRDNPYSSLFEKMYEFASQRRRFVEKEVGSKLPAIGYAYLTSLVGSHFFNNIFTTNFDDLINEAFYQFSNDRPILCAHDSSIRSISITSKRPKIIKLHGDYLFDDIKSTLRETESLEQNTKEKLIEFCKDFGLIVVGYSGSDRSIMDILDFLTKQDNYLNNGIYWCLRENDSINPALRKLLGKEKVYPVIIEGFDELFAEMHSKIKKEGLDFEANIKNSKINQIKLKIIESSSKFENNQYIKKDIENIIKSNDTQEISGLLNKLNKTEDLSLSDLKKFLEIEELINANEHKSAYKLAEDFYYSEKEDAEKVKYVSMLVSISSRMDKNQDCLKWCDKLLEIDPHNTIYIINKSKKIEDLKNKYNYLYDMTDKYPDIYILQNEASSEGLKLLRNNPSTKEFNIEKGISFLDRSLKLFPALSNTAWKEKILLLHKLKSEENRKSNKPDKEIIRKIDIRIDKLISDAQLINQNSISYLNLNITKFINKEDFEELKSLIKKLYKSYETSSLSRRKEINISLNKIFTSFNDFDEACDHKELSRTFYEDHLSDLSIKNNSELLMSKATYLISINREVEKAKTYLNSAFDCNDIFKNMSTAINLSNALDCFKNKELIGLLKKHRSSIYEMYYFEYMYDLSVHANNLSQSIMYIDKAYSLGLSEATYYSEMSYIFIVTSNYQKLIDFEKSHRGKTSKLIDEAFSINHSYALKMMNDPNYNKVHLLNITNGSNKSRYRLAAFAVLGSHSDIRRILNIEIGNSYMNYFRFDKWPIIPKDLLLTFKIKDKIDEKIDDISVA
jgi:hypothetical protein